MGAHVLEAWTRLDGNMSSPITSDAPAARAWLGPLVSTIVTLPTALLLFGIASISAMACDSCESTEAHRFEQSLARSTTGLLIGYAIAGLILLAAWALPHRQRNAACRLALSVLAPCAVGLSYLIFHATVEWPRG
jgi:hypothetical protein